MARPDEYHVFSLTAADGLMTYGYAVTRYVRIEDERIQNVLHLQAGASLMISGMDDEMADGAVLKFDTVEPVTLVAFSHTFCAPTALAALRAYVRERGPGRFTPADTAGLRAVAPAPDRPNTLVVRAGSASSTEVTVPLPPVRPHAWELDASRWMCPSCKVWNSHGERKPRCLLCRVCAACGRCPDPGGERGQRGEGGAASALPQLHTAAAGGGGGSGGASALSATGTEDLDDAYFAAARAAHPDHCTHALPDIDVDFRILFAKLDPASIIRLVNALVCGIGVTLLSDDLEALASVIDAAVALIFPFEWQPNLCIHVRSVCIVLDFLC